MDATVPAPECLGDKRGWKWRAFFLVTLAAVVVTLLGLYAVAFNQSSGAGTGSASTGSVALAANAPATHACAYTALVPGALSSANTCTLAVTYAGSINGFVSLTIAVQSKPGAGGRTLFDGSSNGLTFSVSDGHHTFTAPTGAGTTGGSCPATYTCWSVANDLAAWYSGSTANLTFANTNATTWTLTPLFPKTVGNAYQGATATITLTAQAVQAPANALPATCTASTIGLPCLTGSGFAWS